MSEMAGLSCPELGDVQKGFVGWAGKGGSVFVWDVERKIGFAYVMNGMMNALVGGPRTTSLYEVLREKS